MTGGTAQSTTTSGDPTTAASDRASALPRPMPVLTSTIDPGSDTYRQNRAAMETALAEVDEQLAVARAGGRRALRGAPPEPGQAARPASAIELLLDRDSPFLETRPPGGVGNRLHGGGEPGRRASAW